MPFAERLTAMLERSRPADLIPALASTPGNLIFLEDNYLGCSWMASPLSGASDTTVEQLSGMLSMGLPGNSFVQFSYINSDDVHNVINLYKQRRIDYLERNRRRPRNDTVQEMVNLRAEFIRDGIQNPVIPSNGVYTNETTLVISLKVKSQPIPSEKDIKDAEKLALQFEEALKTVGFFDCHRLTPAQWKGVAEKFFRIRAPLNFDYDDDELLREQVLGAGSRLKAEKNNVVVDDKHHIKVMSIKRLPKQMRLSVMNYLVGDPGGLTKQITVPHILTVTLHYPDQASKQREVGTKATTVNYQSFGALQKFIPKLIPMKQGYDVLMQSLAEGGTAVEMNMTMALYSDSPEELERQAGLVETAWSTFRFEIKPESCISMQVFLNTLPLFPVTETLKGLYRTKTMTVRHAVHFLPIIGEWRGTGIGGGTLLTTRRGQTMLFDLFDSTTNPSFLITSKSGGGKSVVAQQIIVDELSIGSKLWVMDNGRSYEKLCKMVDGEFISFDETSNVCLNPWTKIENIEEEMANLQVLIAKMAAPNEGLNDLEMSALEEVLNGVWTAEGNKATITSVYEFCKNQPKDRANGELLQQLGQRLYPFTDQGKYGQWFEGKNNLEFHKDLVVLELKDLEQNPQLRAVVLLQLQQKIAQEMFLCKNEDAARRKILLIDESQDLLDDPVIGPALDVFYRRVRKHNGSVGIILQSLARLYNTPYGTAIRDNAANMLILEQTDETVSQLIENKQLEFGDDEFWTKEIKTVHTVPGKYAEILFKTPSGVGIGRLVLDRASQVIYSTKGAEREEILANMDAGMSAMDAVQKFLEKEDYDIPYSENSRELLRQAQEFHEILTEQSGRANQATMRAAKALLLARAAQEGKHREERVA